MKKAHSLLIAAAVLGLAATSWLAFRRGPDPGETPAPRTPPPAPPAPRHSDPADRGARDLLWCRRIGDEVLAMVRKPGGQPDAGATLRFLGPSESGHPVHEDSRTDSSGLFRGTVPGAVRQVLVSPGGGFGIPFPAAIPGGTSSKRAMFADRDELRPGDRFRVCIRVARAPGPGQPTSELRFGAPGGSEPEAPPPCELEEEPNPAGPDPYPCWKVFRGMIPDDAPIGEAIVACGSDELPIPVVPRFGPWAGSHDMPPPPGPGTPPAAASLPGELALELRDGEWRAKGPSDAGAVLFFAEAGGRLLSHQGTVAIDGEAATSLPLGERPPAGARVMAVAATPKGFLEASLPVPGAAGEAPPPADSDAVLAAFLAAPRGPGPSATVVEADRGQETRGALVRPGLAEPLFGPGEVPVPETEVRWEIEPGGVEGALRIRCGTSILLETRVGEAGGADEGTLRAGDIGAGPVLVESSAPGLKAVAFSWSVPAPDGDSPARPGRLLSIERALPVRGRLGEEADCRVVLRAGEPCLCSVTCPVPGGAVPAEDGWSIRARAPAGTRVRVEAGAVSLLVPMAKPGEAVLSFRVRFAARGTFPARAASVSCTDLARPGAPLDRARSASGVLAVE